MADFCKQCCKDSLGVDGTDLDNISTEEHTKKGLFASVLCEGCGPTQVNHLGECISPFCLKKHGEQSER